VTKSNLVRQVAAVVPANDRDRFLASLLAMPRGEGRRAVSSAVERLVYTERAGGSNPSPPTIVTWSVRQARTTKPSMNAWSGASRKVAIRIAVSTAVSSRSIPADFLW
jgi:hypothetical protein